MKHICGFFSAVMIFSAVLFSCGKDSNHNDNAIPDEAAASVLLFSGNLYTDLQKSGISEDKARRISDGGSAEATEAYQEQTLLAVRADLSWQDIKIIAPAFTRGAMRAIKTIPLFSGEPLRIAKSIARSAVHSLGQSKVSFSDDQLSTVLQSIIGQSLSNLKKAGFSSETYAQTGSEIVSSFIGKLGALDIPSDSLSPILRDILESAGEAITGYSEINDPASNPEGQNLLAGIYNGLTRGASGGLASVKKSYPSIDESTLGDWLSGIVSGAVQSMGYIQATQEQQSQLVKWSASGVLESLDELGISPENSGDILYQIGKTVSSLFASIGLESSYFVFAAKDLIYGVHSSLVGAGLSGSGIAPLISRVIDGILAGIGEIPADQWDGNEPDTDSLRGQLEQYASGNLVSSARDILAFTFDPTQNAALDQWIAGEISGTTITMTLPYGTDASSLSPTIAFSGIQVRPPSGAAQDFTAAGGVTYTVTAADGETKIYTVVIAYQPDNTPDNAASSNNSTALSHNAALSSLSFSSGTLSPAFSADTVSYTLSVDYSTSTINITTATSDANASVDIKKAGTVVTSPVSLSLGTNDLDIIVTAEDGSTRQIYRVSVTRTGATIAVSSASNPLGTLPSISGYSLTITPSGSTSTITANPYSLNNTITIPSGVSVQITLTATVAAGQSSAALEYTGTASGTYDAGSSNSLSIPVRVSKTKIVAVDPQNGRLVQINDMTGTGWKAVVAADIGYSSQNLYNTKEVDFDSLGRIYIANLSGSTGFSGILRIDDMHSTTYNSLIQDVGAMGIAIDRTRDILYYVTTNKLYRIDLNIHCSSFPCTSTELVVSSVTATYKGIDVDGTDGTSGILYIANGTNGIIKYDPAKLTVLKQNTTISPADIWDVLVKDTALYATNVSGGSGNLLLKLSKTDLSLTQGYGTPVNTQGTKQGDLYGPRKFLAIPNKEITISDDYPTFGTNLDEIVSMDDIPPSTWQTYGTSGSGTGQFAFYSLC